MLVPFVYFQIVHIKKHLITLVTGMALPVDINHMLSKAVPLLGELVADGTLQLWVRLVVVAQHVLFELCFVLESLFAQFTGQSLVDIANFISVHASLMLEQGIFQEKTIAKLTGIFQGLPLGAVVPFMGQHVLLVVKSHPTRLAQVGPLHRVTVFSVFHYQKAGNEGKFSVSCPRRW